ncbi:50S ribosomal protein L10 [Eupransor demetentiae]|uniref:Large ribosomal subunit protein uL10 n=1 Tax=Eupransor demetentiae TaxID=3109584 RepID=A0ABP0ES17_9LACO|nr:Ribosomal protein L10 (RplJ) [Lactobacillaceae bacterium LMG 33000]
MSEQAIALKAKKVEAVADQFKNATSAVIINMRGLSVADSTELRHQLREEGVLLEVIKNKVLVRAAEKAGYAELNDLFKGPSAVAFSDEDAVAPARILKKFADESDAVEIKGGVVDGSIASLDDIAKYASLPSHDGLLGQLMAELQYPIRTFAYAVNALREKKEAEGEGSDAAAE